MIFWKNVIWKENKIKKEALIESRLIDFRIKNLNLIEELERIEKINKPDSNLDDGDWSSYKKNKKNKVFGDFNKKKLKKILNVFLINNNKKLLLRLKRNLNTEKILKNKFIDLFYRFFTIKSKIKNSFIFKFYNSINLNKLNQINKNNYFLNFNKKLIIIIDIRNIKPRIVVINNNKCILTLSTGIIFKKMQMKEKSIKKTQKMFNIMMKLVSTNLKKKINCNNYIIHIKGTKSKLLNILVFIKKSFINNNLFFLYSPRIDYKIKFKKIKSIKRRLKKKFVRFK